MNLLNTESRLFRAVNGLVLTAMLLNISMPTAYALSAPGKTTVVSPVKESGMASRAGMHTAGIRTLITSPKEISRTEVSTKSARATLARIALSGPGQAESSGFSLSSTDDMVDKFTGDFSYSIPLADIEGYPIVLSYNSNILMNSEASWVGLGWDLNVGAVSREMRGLPDEFNGEQQVVKTFNQVNNGGDGFKAGGFVAGGYRFGAAKIKYTPKVQLTALGGRYDDNYLGRGRTFDFGLQASPSLSTTKLGLFVAPTFGIGYRSDTKRGVGVSHNYGFSAGMSNGTNNVINASFDLGVSKSFHSRQGLTEKSRSFSADLGNNGNGGFTASYGATSSIPYGTLTSVPSVRMNSFGTSTDFNLNLYAGKALNNWLVSVGFILKDFSSTDRISLNAQQQLLQPALGYFHSGKYAHYKQGAYSLGTITPLMDFNRGNDQEYSEEMKNLAFSIQTYDIFRANAMGLGATFRARRTDIGTYQDPVIVSRNDLEGNGVTLGVIVAPSRVTGEIGVSEESGGGRMQSGNFPGTDGSNVLDFVQEASKGTRFDSPVYFKGVGESTPEDLSDFQTLGELEPTYLSMQASSDERNVELTGLVTGKDFSPYTVDKNTLNASSYEPVRAMYYRPFTAEEYETKELYYHSFTGFANGLSDSPLNRKQTIDANKPNYSNHLSAVEVVNTDGTKYVFGIPAYELNSSQVSFSATGLTDPDGDGVTTYNPDDNDVTNGRGVAHYFDKTTVPAYPHSFLLSEMLSSDYIDRTDNGPTLDDAGSYYKFNYTRVYHKDNPYIWRFPVESQSAYFSRGLLGTNLDDMANYQYGEKEIWYTHSVESRNLIAEFQLEDREDACGVAGEDGGINTAMKLRRLKKIVVYNRSERLGPNGSTAIPLQTIEFEYTYELCPGNPSNSGLGVGNAGGKLTLKKIRSYSGNSQEMGLYTYEFGYDDATTPVNKSFSYLTDAWGNYKAPNASKPNDVYPYAIQDETESNKLAKNWKLTKITTPANGILEISYQADSYATVQDKSAMQHIDVVGMTNIKDLLDLQSGATWNYQTATNVYTAFNNYYPNSSYSNWSAMDNYMEQFGHLDRTNVPNNVLVFRLGSEIAGTNSVAQASDILKQAAFTDVATGQEKLLTELLLRLHVQVKDGVDELVPAFGKISANFGSLRSIGVMPKADAQSNYKYGYVILDPAVVDDKDGEQKGTVFNSLQKSAIEFIRRNLPDVVYNASPSGPNQSSNLILDRAVALKKEDINLLMNRANWAPSIITDFTTVRLYVASGKKIGGTGRVSQLIYRDNWTSMSGENIPGIYTWSYNYGNNSTTGNAAFEPHAMIDECALYQWDTYVNKVEKYPDETKFTPTPIALPLYPAPVIGYEKVIVSINGTANQGYSQSEFHTSRTKPMVSRISDIQKNVHVKEPTSVLGGNSTDKFGYSQGFVIETNDFHGKPDKTTVYSLVEETVNGNLVQTPVAQAQTTYVYAGMNDKQPMLARNSATITPEYISQEVDVHTDTRYVHNNFEFNEFGASLSITWTPVGIYPMIFPIYYHSTRTQAFYSSALIKHINRSAVVTKIITEQLGSINSAENHVYDYHTGNVVLTSLKDEYNDQLFSMSAPSHWYYKELRELYSSQDVTVSVSIAADGTITGADELLTPGDQVKIMNLAGTPTAWVAKHNASTSGDLFLMGSAGSASGDVTVAGTYQLKIEKSNRDNRLNETMMSVVTKKNPITTIGNTSTFAFPQIEIISAGALTYRDRNNLKCGTPNDKENPNNNNEVTLNSNVNPYTYGIRGDLVADGQYAWQSERNNALHPYKTRFDGTYTTYSPFYVFSAGKWTMATQPAEPPVATAGWRKMGEVTTYNEFGVPLESKDQLDIYSSVLYGYDRTFALVPVAQAVNARQQEIAFDGFEDHGYYTLQSTSIQNNVPHFDFKNADAASTNISLDQTQRHSGLNSLKLVANANATVVAQVDASTCSGSSVVDPRCNCFEVQECACIEPFKPTPGDYLVSAWVKNDNPLVTANGTIRITVAGSGMTTQYYTIIGSGPVIDGWQRMEGTFNIPLTGAETVTVTLQHNSGTSVNFDDFRIHPLLAGMTTTVYDPKTLLPMASHDGYNFTTFYNYDENLNLVRVRVETIEGIKTVSESEMGGLKR